MQDLRARLGIILALAMLPLLAFSIWRSFSDFAHDEALVRRNADMTAQLALNATASNLETTKSILSFTAVLLDESDCRASLNRLTSGSPRFENIIQTDSSGTVECAANPETLSAEQIAQIKAEITPDTPFATRFLNVKTKNRSSKKVIVTAYANYAQGELNHIFIAVENFDFLLMRLMNSKILEGNELAAIDGKGKLLGGGWQDADFQNIAEKFSVAQFDAGVKTRDSAGRAIMILPTRADDVYLAIATDRKKILFWNRFNPLAYAAIPIFAWLFGFAAIWLSTDQLILIHIRRMRRAALQFAKGDRNARVGKLINPPSAIYALGKNFDEMADRIVEREATIGDSLAEKETLLREIHHRVKNNLQIIISLLNMQERKLKDKKGLSAIVETRSRINAIALVHKGLYESQDLRYVNMQMFLDRLLPELALAFGLNERGIDVTGTADCKPMEADTATPVALFIVEALTNSVKHGVGTGGAININIFQTGSEITVSVSDSGGTIADSQNNQGGIGTKLMKGFARQLGGTLDKKSDETGYEVKLSFTPREIIETHSIST